MVVSGVRVSGSPFCRELKQRGLTPLRRGHAARSMRETGTSPGVPARPGGTGHEDEGRQGSPGTPVRAGGRPGTGTASLPDRRWGGPQAVVAGKACSSNQAVTGL